MAHDHEKITYDMNDVKELFDASVLTGTIVSVDTDNDKAHVNISGFGQINDVPIFYHCPGSDVVEDGSVAFSDGDNVYILNKKGRISPVASDLQIVGFVDGLKSCEWNEEWDSTFCGNHQWEERINYYDDWMGVNGIYECDTAPTAETTLDGELIHHLHENLGYTHNNYDHHVISLSGADGSVKGITRVLFKFPVAQLMGTPAHDFDRWIRFSVAYIGQDLIYNIKNFYLAFAGAGSPIIYPPGIGYDELIDEGRPVTVYPGGTQVRIHSTTRRLVTAEWSCDYIRFRR